MDRVNGRRREGPPRRPGAQAGLRSCPGKYGSVSEVKLLEQGNIPFVKVGAYRRIRLEDLMEYKERRDAQREKAIAEMTQMCQDWGIYD